MTTTEPILMSGEEDMSGETLDPDVVKRMSTYKCIKASCRTPFSWQPTLNDVPLTTEQKMRLRLSPVRGPEFRDVFWVWCCPHCGTVPLREWARLNKTREMAGETEASSLGDK
jgi:hypothetical protein